MEPKKSPTPPVVVGGTGVPSITSNHKIMGTILYQYPSDFPDECRGRVKLEEIEAGQEFNKAAPEVQWKKRLWDMRIACLMRPVKAFAKEAVQLGRDASRIESNVRDLALYAAHWAGLETRSPEGVMPEIEASPEWEEYNELLLNRAMRDGSQRSLVPMPDDLEGRFEKTRRKRFDCSHRNLAGLGRGVVGFYRAASG